MSWRSCKSVNDMFFFFILPLSLCIWTVITQSNKTILLWIAVVYACSFMSAVNYTLFVSAYPSTECQIRWYMKLTLCLLWYCEKEWCLASLKCKRIEFIKCVKIFHRKKLFFGNIAVFISVGKIFCIFLVTLHCISFFFFFWTLLPFKSLENLGF